MTTHRYERSSFFRPGEIPRLLALVGMLLVMGMLVFEARNPAMWRWLANDAETDQNAAETATAKPAKIAATQPNATKPESQSAVSSPASPATETADPAPHSAPSEAKPHESNSTNSASEAVPPASPPAASPPPAAEIATEKEPDNVAGTDLDPEEQAEFQKDLPRICDLSTEIQPLEMKPYLRLFHWVQLQSLDSLRKRAVKPQMFREYAQKVSAEDHRGELLRVNLEVRRINVLPVDDIEELKSMGIDRIYEIYGTTPDSQPYLWCCVTPNLPKGLKTGDMFERAKFYGFFFKVHAYSPGTAKTARPWPAPLLVGRLDWQPPKAAVVTPASDWNQAIIVGAVVGVALCGLVLYLVLNRGQKSPLSGSLPSPEASAAGFAEFLERGTGNSAYGDSPPVLPEQYTNGHSSHEMGLPFSDQSEA